MSKNNKNKELMYKILVGVLAAIMVAGVVLPLLLYVI